MLDMATNCIVLAGIQPNANAVSTKVYLNALDALGRERTTTFRASQRALTLPHRRSERNARTWPCQLFAT